MKIDITKLMEILEKLKNYLIKDYDLTSSDFQKINTSIESITSIKFPIKKFYSFLISFWLKDSNEINSSVFYEKMIYYFHRYNQEEENIDLDFITIENNYEFFENDFTIGSNRKNSSNFTIKTLNNFMNIQMKENSVLNTEEYLDKKNCYKKNADFHFEDLEKKNYIESFCKMSPISKRYKFFSKDNSYDLENIRNKNSLHCNFEKSEEYGSLKNQRSDPYKNKRSFEKTENLINSENGKKCFNNENEKYIPLLKTDFQDKEKKNLFLDKDFFEEYKINDKKNYRRKKKSDFFDKSSKEISSSKKFDDDFSISEKSKKKIKKDKIEKIKESKKFITKVNSPFPPKNLKKKRKNIFSEKKNLSEKKILNKNIINENMIKKLDINNLPKEYKNFLKNFLEEILKNKISLENLLDNKNSVLLKNHIKNINEKNDLSDIFEETEKYSSEEDKEKNFIFGQKKNLEEKKISKKNYDKNFGKEYFFDENDKKKKFINEKGSFLKKETSVKKSHRILKKKINLKNKKKLKNEEEIKFRKKHTLSFHNKNKKSFEESLKKILFYKNLKRKISPKKKLKKNLTKNNLKMSINNFKKKTLKKKINYRKSFSKKKIYKKSLEKNPKKKFKKSLEKKNNKKSFKIKKQFSTQLINNLKKHKETSSNKKDYFKTEKKKFFCKSNDKNLRKTRSPPLISFKSLSSSRKNFSKKKKFFNMERNKNFTNIYQ